MAAPEAVEVTAAPQLDSSEEEVTEMVGLLFTVTKVGLEDVAVHPWVEVTLTVYPPL